MSTNQQMTFGDVRRMILETIADLKNEKIDVNRGMAIAANFKVLNDNIQTEINAAKMAYLTRNEAHNFGQMVGMGRRLIGNDDSQPSA